MQNTFSLIYFSCEKCFPVQFTSDLWTLKNNEKVIPLTIVSFCFSIWSPLLHLLNSMYILRFFCSCYLCVLGDRLNPPLPSRTSLPPTLVIWLAAHTKAHPAPPGSGAAAAADNSIIPVVTAVIVDVPLVKWFHPPTPVPVVSPTTHEGVSCPPTTCKQTKYFYMDHTRWHNVHNVYRYFQSSATHSLHSISCLAASFDLV